MCLFGRASTGCYCSRRQMWLPPPPHPPPPPPSPPPSTASDVVASISGGAWALHWCSCSCDCCYSNACVLNSNTIGLLSRFWQSPQRRQYRVSIGRLDHVDVVRAAISHVAHGSIRRKVHQKLKNQSSNLNECGTLAGNTANTSKYAKNHMLECEKLTEAGNGHKWALWDNPILCNVYRISEFLLVYDADSISSRSRM